jgi:hypothetical protein
MEADVLAAMSAANLPPEFAYAYKKTGLLETSNSGIAVFHSSLLGRFGCFDAASMARYSSKADARKCRAAMLAKLAAFFQACVAARALHRCSPQLLRVSLAYRGRIKLTRKSHGKPSIRSHQRPCQPLIF